MIGVSSVKHCLVQRDTDNEPVTHCCWCCCFGRQTWHLFRTANLIGCSKTFAFCVKIFMSNPQIRFFKNPFAVQRPFFVFFFVIVTYCFELYFIYVGLPSCKFFRWGINLNRNKGILTEGSRRWLNLRYHTDCLMQWHFIQLRVIDCCVEICFSDHILPILGRPTCPDHKNKNTSHYCPFVTALRPVSRSCWKC